MNNNLSNPYELVIKSTKKIESILEKEWEVDGRGLGEKVSSISHEIPNSLLVKIYKISGIRNKVVHNDDFENLNINEFTILTNDIISLLHKEIENKNSTENKNQKSNSNSTRRIISNKNNKYGLDFHAIKKYLLFIVAFLAGYFHSVEAAVSVFFGCIFVYFLFIMIFEVAFSILKTIHQDMKRLAYWLARMFY